MTIREGQDALARIGLAIQRQRVHDKIRSWSSTPVQPGPTIGELGLENLSDSIRRVVMSPTFIRERVHAIHRALYHRIQP